MLLTQHPSDAHFKRQVTFVPAAHRDSYFCMQAQKPAFQKHCQASAQQGHAPGHLEPSTIWSAAKLNSVHRHLGSVYSPSQGRLGSLRANRISCSTDHACQPIWPEQTQLPPQQYAHLTTQHTQRPLCATQSSRPVLHHSLSYNAAAVAFPSGMMHMSTSRAQSGRESSSSGGSSSKRRKGTKPPQQDVSNANKTFQKHPQGSGPTLSRSRSIPASAAASFANSGISSLTGVTQTAVCLKQSQQAQAPDALADLSGIIGRTADLPQLHSALLALEALCFPTSSLPSLCPAHLPHLPSASHPQYNATIETGSKAPATESAADTARLSLGSESSPDRKMDGGAAASHPDGNDVPASCTPGPGLHAWEEERVIAALAGAAVRVGQLVSAASCTRSTVQLVGAGGMLEDIVTCLQRVKLLQQLVPCAPHKQPGSTSSSSLEQFNKYDASSGVGSLLTSKTTNDPSVLAHRLPQVSSSLVQLLSACVAVGELHASLLMHHVLLLLASCPPVPSAQPLLPQPHVHSVTDDSKEAIAKRPCSHPMPLLTDTDKAVDASSTTALWRVSAAPAASEALASAGVSAQSQSHENPLLSLPHAPLSFHFSGGEAASLQAVAALDSSSALQSCLMSYLPLEQLHDLDYLHIAFPRSSLMHILSLLHRDCTLARLTHRLQAAPATLALAQLVPTQPPHQPRTSGTSKARTTLYRQKRLDALTLHAAGIGALSYPLAEAVVATTLTKAKHLHSPQVSIALWNLFGPANAAVTQSVRFAFNHIHTPVPGVRTPWSDSVKTDFLLLFCTLQLCHRSQMGICDERLAHVQRRLSLDLLHSLSVQEMSRRPVAAAPALCMLLHIDGQRGEAQPEAHGVDVSSISDSVPCPSQQQASSSSMHPPHHLQPGIDHLDSHSSPSNNPSPPPIIDHTSPHPTPPQAPHAVQEGFDPAAPCNPRPRKSTLLWSSLLQGLSTLQPVMLPLLCNLAAASSRSEEHRDKTHALLCAVQEQLAAIIAGPAALPAVTAPKDLSALQLLTALTSLPPPSTSAPWPPELQTSFYAVTGGHLSHATPAQLESFITLLATDPSPHLSPAHPIVERSRWAPRSLEQVREDQQLQLLTNVADAVVSRFPNSVHLKSLLSLINSLRQSNKVYPSLLECLSSRLDVVHQDKHGLFHSYSHQDLCTVIAQCAGVAAPPRTELCNHDPGKRDPVTTGQNNLAGSPSPLDTHLHTAPQNSTSFSAMASKLGLQTLLELLSRPASFQIENSSTLDLALRASEPLNIRSLPPVTLQRVLENILAQPLVRQLTLARTLSDLGLFDNNDSISKELVNASTNLWLQQRVGALHPATADGALASNQQNTLRSTPSTSPSHPMIEYSTHGSSPTHATAVSVPPDSNVHMIHPLSFKILPDPADLDAALRQLSAILDLAQAQNVSHALDSRASSLGEATVHILKGLHTRSLLAARRDRLAEQGVLQQPSVVQIQHTDESHSSLVAAVRAVEQLADLHNSLRDARKSRRREGEMVQAQLAAALLRLVAESSDAAPGLPDTEAVGIRTLRLVLGTGPMSMEMWEQTTQLLPPVLDMLERHDASKSDGDVTHFSQGMSGPVHFPEI